MIKARRSGWLKHVVRIDDEKTVERLLIGKPGGGRKKGRPRLRWMDDFESDLRNLGVKIWRTEALERGGEGQT